MQQELGVANVAERPATTLPAGPGALLDGSPWPPGLPTQPLQGCVAQGVPPRPLVLGCREPG